MADDFLQIITDAREDAISFSEFMFEPIDFMVERRLAPPINTFNYWLDYIPRTITEAIDDTILGDYRTDLTIKIDDEIERAVSKESEIVAALEDNSELISNNSDEISKVKLDTGITATAKFGGVERTQADKNTEQVSVKDFGAIGDGEHHPVSELIPSRFASLLALQSAHPYVTSLNDSIDWLAFQAATEYGGEIHVPRGTYYLNKKVSMRRNTLYKGLGIKKSVVVSYVSNASLFQLDKTFIFGGFIDLGISAHSSVSLSSGHGIDASGEAIGDDESHTPQYLLIERCRVSGFKGTGVSPSSTTPTTAACGLIQSYGISTRLKQSLFDDNGAGVYLYSTSTSRIESCSFATNTYWGLHAELNTNLIVSGGNFVHNGTGSQEVAQTLFGKSETGNVGFFGNYGSVFTCNKTKGTRSTADIVISSDEGTVITQNNIRGAYSVVHDAVQCIYIKTVRGLVINSNTFHGINITEANASATATYKAITFKPDSLFFGTQASVCDNTFRGITASKVGYFLGLIGSNSAKKIMFIGMVITGNNLSNDNRVAPWSIDTAILLKDCRLKHSTIANNTCYVSSTLTIDSVINFSNVNESDNIISGNSAYYAVTTAVDTTANIPIYKGVVPDKREYTYHNANATQILANAVLDIIIDAKNTLPTELVYTETTFSLQTSLTFKSWISEAGKITIRVSNNSNTSMTLPIGYFNVLLKRASRIDAMNIS